MRLRLLVITAVITGCAHSRPPDGDWALDEVTEDEAKPGTGGSSLHVERDPDGKIHRRRSVIAEFMKRHPCPYPPDVGSSTRCRSGRADHRIPLCAGGPDEVANLQWQTVDAAHQKDYLEDWVCRHGGVREP